MYEVTRKAVESAAAEGEVRQYGEAVVMTKDDWEVIAKAVSWARSVVRADTLPAEVEAGLVGMQFVEKG